MLDLPLAGDPAIRVPARESEVAPSVASGSLVRPFTRSGPQPPRSDHLNGDLASGLIASHLEYGGDTLPRELNALYSPA